LKLFITPARNSSVSHTVTLNSVTEIEWVVVSHLTQHKTGHFRDVLPSQSLGLALKN